MRKRANPSCRLCSAPAYHSAQDRCPPPLFCSRSIRTYWRYVWDERRVEDPEDLEELDLCLLHASQHPPNNLFGQEAETNDGRGLFSPTCASYLYNPSGQRIQQDNVHDITGEVRHV